LLGIDPGAAGRLQRFMLDFERLPVGADAGVPENSHIVPHLCKLGICKKIRQKNQSQSVSCIYVEFCKQTEAAAQMWISPRARPLSIWCHDFCSHDASAGIDMTGNAGRFGARTREPEYGEEPKSIAPHRSSAGLEG